MIIKIFFKKTECGHNVDKQIHDLLLSRSTEKLVKSLCLYLLELTDVLNHSLTRSRRFR